MKKLNKNFYMRTSLEVAKDLLCKYLVVKKDNKKFIGKIVEVEAYMGTIDKAAHSYKGKTKRTETMFKEGSVVYVYLIYGMYNCINVVCNKENLPEAVLIRAVEPIEDLDAIAFNRYNKPFSELKKREKINLTSGPGKLCKAFNITKEDNGKSLLKDEIYIAEDENSKEKFDIVETKRIGIDYAEEAKDFPWRFYIKENPYISKP